MGVGVKITHKVNLEISMPAKMPEARLQQPTGTIADIPIGGEAIVGVLDVKVDLDRSCYLNPKGEILDGEEGVMAIKVRRDHDGFHLELNPHSIPFHPNPIHPKQRGKLIPVISISEGTAGSVS
jgi:hypothetical protein